MFNTIYYFSENLILNNNVQNDNIIASESNKNNFLLFSKSDIIRLLKDS